MGIETSDDAAVYQINDEQAIVATTDFFMPIVDDPFDFGAIAATNAISDVYAMGGVPLFALALVGMPVNQLPLEVIRRILAGGEAICARAGIPIAGGHTIDSVEPIYGLVALGLVHPDRLLTNRTGQAGDVLILEADDEGFERIASDPGILMMMPFQAERTARRRAPVAAAIMLGTVLLAAFDVLSIEIAGLAGAVAMVLSGCLTGAQAYRAIDTRIYVFIAGAIPLGIAMKSSGAAKTLAGWLQAAVISGRICNKRPCIGPPGRRECVAQTP